MKIKEIIAPADYTTRLGERVSYWTYFVGQKIGRASCRERV